ncbi:Hypothetical predicted protein [Marmota monax]|uniref:Uncharacterized protein n=1 Tax=Marmota monax TaxID=9995 RepID=A0A5E4ACA6_MARMO|nr:Hypothetical predicted protein [Marmota monax]
MELSVLLLLALLTGLFLLLVRGHPKASGHLPPGPRPLPFLGNLLQMDRRGLLNSFLRVRQMDGALRWAGCCLCTWGSLSRKSKASFQLRGWVDGWCVKGLSLNLDGEWSDGQRHPCSAGAVRGALSSRGRVAVQRCVDVSCGADLCCPPSPSAVTWVPAYPWKRGTGWHQSRAYYFCQQEGAKAGLSQGWDQAREGGQGEGG